MNELSLYILDLTQNSVTAGAEHISIDIEAQSEADTLAISIRDDGCGMDAALLSKVTSPFTTTRTTRKVGLGIPMAKQLCEMCAGDFAIHSRVGEGTTLNMRFQLSHVDLPPMGNLPETIVALITGAPETIDFDFSYAIDGKRFSLSTIELKNALGGVRLSTPEVLNWIREYASEGIALLNEV